MAYAGEAGTLLPGQTEVLTAGLAFGNYEQTSIHGYKFNDLNGNGLDNSDPRLAGWTILLVGTDGQGNPVSTSTTTVANGEYSFTGLAPGTYTVSEQGADRLDANRGRSDVHADQRSGGGGVCR